MQAAALFALGRLGYSGGLIFAPSKVAGPWLGAAQARDPSTQIALRGLAAREAVLAAGTLVATLRQRSPRGWLVLCALGDLGDIAATLAAPPANLPDNARIGTIVLAGGAALLGAALALSARPSRWPPSPPSRLSRLSSRAAADSP